MDKNTLIMVEEWAQARVDSNMEPPFTYHKLKKLSEILRELVSGMDATVNIDIPNVDAKAASATLPENVIALENFMPEPEVSPIALPS